MDLYRKPGIHRPEDLGSQNGMDCSVLRLSRAARLADLTEEFAFFTHAPFFTHARWNRDPALDYAEATPGCEVHVIICNQPLFTGLHVRRPDGSRDESWNYRLMACHRSHWVGLRDYLMAVGGVDRARKLFHRTLAQVIPLIDGIAMDRLSYLPDAPPMIHIMTFSIDSNHFILPFVPALNPPFDQVRLEMRTAEPATVRLAEAYFSGHPVPHQVIEPEDTQLLLMAARKQNRVLRDAMSGKIHEASPDELERLVPHINEFRRGLGIKSEGDHEDRSADGPSHRGQDHSRGPAGNN